MANTAWRNVRARCPYYHKSYDVSITCQCDDMISTIRMRFSDEERCDQHFRRCCATHYRQCQIYQLIDRILEGKA